MLFVWLLAALKWIAKLFIPPPKKKKPRAVDLSAPCLACGHAGFSLACVVISSKPGAVNALTKTLLRFTCKTCGAFWYTNPLFSSNPGAKANPEEIGADTVIEGLTK